MKGEAMLATLQRRSVAASRSRPAVSNDHPFSEALLRTLKYQPNGQSNGYKACCMRAAARRSSCICTTRSIGTVLSAP